MDNVFRRVSLLMTDGMVSMRLSSRKRFTREFDSSATVSSSVVSLFWLRDRPAR